MKIGKLNLEVVAPTDLKGSLLESCGCSPKEVVELLQSYPIASTVAMALNPFLKDPLPVPELSDAIAEEGLDVVTLLVLAMYAEGPSAP